MSISTCGRTLEATMGAVGVLMSRLSITPVEGEAVYRLVLEPYVYAAVSCMPYDESSGN